MPENEFPPRQYVTFGIAPSGGIPKNYTERTVRTGVDRDGVEVWEHSVVIIHGDGSLSLFPSGPPLSDAFYVCSDNRVRQMFVDAGFISAFVVWEYLQESGCAIYGARGLIGASSVTHEQINRYFHRAPTSGWASQRLAEIDMVVGLLREPRIDFMTNQLTGFGYYVGGMRRSKSRTYSNIANELTFAALLNMNRPSPPPSASARRESRRRGATSDSAGQLGDIIVEVADTDGSSPNNHVGMAAQLRRVLAGTEGGVENGDLLSPQYQGVNEESHAKECSNNEEE